MISVSDDWARACIRYGEMMTEARGILSQYEFGLRMIELGHEALGNETELEHARQRVAEFDTIFAERSDALAYMYRDKTLFSEYVEEIALTGEWQAMTNMISSVEQLRRYPDYDPCAAMR